MLRWGMVGLHLCLGFGTRKTLGVFDVYFLIYILCNES